MMPPEFEQVHRTVYRRVDNNKQEYLFKYGDGRKLKGACLKLRKRHLVRDGGTDGESERFEVRESAFRVPDGLRLEKCRVHESGGRDHLEDGSANEVF